MKDSSKILVAVGAGLAIGGILGVLFAPDKGSETRKKMANAGDELKSRFKEKLNQGKEMFSFKKDAEVEHHHSANNLVM